MRPWRRSRDLTSTTTVTIRCSSWNASIQSNSVWQMMDREWVVQRLLRVLRGNDWYPAEMVPSDMICLDQRVRVVVVERSRVRGVDELYDVSPFSLPLPSELVIAMTSHPFWKW